MAANGIGISSGRPGTSSVMPAEMSSDEREERAEEYHLPKLGVRLPAVEHHQQPEDAQHDRVVEQHPERARKPEVVGPAPPQLGVQRDELGAGVFRDRLSHPYDPLSRFAPSP